MRRGMNSLAPQVQQALGRDPRAWLADVLGRIADHPASRLAELLPWNWAKARELAAAA
jgi:hypothetical protein